LKVKVDYVTLKFQISVSDGILSLGDVTMIQELIIRYARIVCVIHCETKLKVCSIFSSVSFYNKVFLFIEALVSVGAHLAMTFRRFFGAN